MAKWAGKTKGGVIGYSIFIFVLKHFHIKFAYFILRFVAAYFLLFSDKKGIRYYFRTRLGYSKFKTFVSIYKNYYIFGQVLLDKVALLAGFTKKFTFEFEGEQHLHNMAKNKTGGVLIGAHVGNWEIAGQLLDRIDSPIHIVMLDAEHEKIKTLLDGVMSEKTMKIIPIKNDFSHLKAIGEALSNKEIVAIHGDRYLPGTNAVSSEFLGEEALFPSGPLYLSTKYKVPVTFVSAMKESASHYHFFATEPKVYKYPGNLKTRKAEIKNMVIDYVTELERVVKGHPLQWFNYYQFWENSNK